MPDVPVDAWVIAPVIDRVPLTVMHPAALELVSSVSVGEQSSVQASALQSNVWPASFEPVAVKSFPVPLARSFHPAESVQLPPEILR
jgi:hypothetical protein